jgi:hypothetical protein
MNNLLQFQKKLSLDDAAIYINLYRPKAYIIKIATCPKFNY